MTCEELKAYIARFYDESLSEKEKEELGYHLGNCEECREAAHKILAAFSCIKKYYEVSGDFKIEGLDKNIMKHVISKKAEALD